MELKVPYQEFKTRMDVFQSEFALLSKTSIRTEEELMAATTKFNDVKSAIVSYVSESFSDDIRLKMVQDIRQENYFQIPGKQSLTQQIRQLQQRSESRKNAAQYLIWTIEASDSMRLGKSMASERTNWTMRKKADFLLEKLYDLRKYPVSWNAGELFQFNEVEMGSQIESRQISEDLINKGLVEGYGGIGDYMLQLSPDGVQYVEELHERKPDLAIASNLSPKIFISHSSHDRVAVNYLVELLQSSFNFAISDIRCSSISNHQLPVGSLVDEQLKKEVTSAALVLGLLTSRSVKSNYVMFELGARWGTSKALLPLYANDNINVDLEGPLSGIHGITLNSKDNVRILLNAIRDQLDIGLNDLIKYENHIDDFLSSISAIQSAS